MPMQQVLNLAQELMHDLDLSKLLQAAQLAEDGAPTSGLSVAALVAATAAASGSAAQQPKRPRSNEKDV